MSSLRPTAYLIQPDAGCSLSAQELIETVVERLRAQFEHESAGLSFLATGQDAKDHLGNQIIARTALCELTLQIDPGGDSVFFLRAPNELDSYAELHSMAFNDKPLLRDFEAGALAIRNFKSSDWHQSFSFVDQGANALTLYEIASECVVNDSSEQHAAFKQITGVDAAAFFVNFHGICATHDHLSKFGLLPSQAKADYPNQAEQLSTQLVGTAYELGGFAMCCLNIDHMRWLAINEDQYLSTVYLQIGPSQPKVSAEHLSAIDVVQMCLRDPSQFRVSSGLEPAIEEALMLDGYSESEHPNCVRTFARSEDDPVVVVAKVSARQAKETLEPLQQEAMAQLQYTPASELPCWLSSVPESEISTTLDAIGHKLPAVVREQLYAPNGECKITNALVLASEGDITDVYVTESSRTYSSAAEYYPLLIGDSAFQPELQRNLDATHEADSASMTPSL